MGVDGIGARVLRKEDKRFITGKGRYVDDINRPGQTYAVFVRSPHAHATIKSTDTKAATRCGNVRSIGANSEMKATGTAKSGDRLAGMACPKRAPRKVQIYQGM